MLERESGGEHNPKCEPKRTSIDECDNGNAKEPYRCASELENMLAGGWLSAGAMAGYLRRVPI